MVPYLSVSFPPPPPPPPHVLDIFPAARATMDQILDLIPENLKEIVRRSIINLDNTVEQVATNISYVNRGPRDPQGNPINDDRITELIEIARGSNIRQSLSAGHSSLTNSEDNTTHRTDAGAEEGHPSVHFLGGLVSWINQHFRRGEVVAQLSRVAPIIQWFDESANHPGEDSSEPFAPAASGEGSGVGLHLQSQHLEQSAGKLSY